VTDIDTYGRLAADGERWQLEFTRRLPHPPEKVWRALTEPDLVSQWFPSDIVGERTEGADLRFRFRHGEGPELGGTMLRYEPHVLLEFSWAEELLRFELTPDGDGGTVLRFVNTFDELGKAARDAAGWHACLDILACRLDGTPPPENRWKEVSGHYTEAFGPEASAIGPPADDAHS
jgi:uncharacterized protein YndB with AHSA1/START domain